MFALFLTLLLADIARTTGKYFVLMSFGRFLHSPPLLPCIHVKFRLYYWGYLVTSFHDQVRSFHSQNSGLRENILEEAPCLNKKKIVIGYRALDGEFCEVNGEFSHLQCLMNTLKLFTGLESDDLQNKG